NDTSLSPETLRVLVHRAEQDDRIGLVSPLIRDYDPPQDIQFAGAFADLRKHHFATVSADVFSRMKPSETVLWGTALLVKSRLIRSVGLLDELYFAYQEDIEYSIRSLEAGFVNVLVPQAIVYHKGAGSSGGVDTRFRHYLIMRNEHLVWHSRVRGAKRLA